ncbi:discoidin domain-containing protein [Saccharopolyspora sp. K220]|uniref:MGH1-like glycoside hydrolase domain-containing protein n=1 Tax=Saccharopolyspora soli TaxID=2926618 RepID=UPI001F59012A|nr:discoidin domain-containing protein [Saccharopolyspora soli]MCI2416086.1 discoidin domain-containing protein [Saccharopolyspora soli]
MDFVFSRRALLRSAVAGTTAFAGEVAPASSGDGESHAPSSPYPEVGPGTQFLDHAALLDGLPEPGWFAANIPLVDVPEPEIQQVYYYRWRVFYEALKYTGPAEGWIVTEFLAPVGYSAPGGAIAAAAGHHLTEGRWLRDRRYLDDYLRYWLRGSGASYKEPSLELNRYASDWAHQYSFWAADAVWKRASVTGDWAAARDLLPELVRQWERWAPQYDAGLGLYWQSPVWDGMEYSASSYQSKDPFRGGEGFRPTVNSYQYADARRIAELARFAGDNALAARFDEHADRLRAAHAQLWDAEAQFFKHMMRDDNPGRALLVDREQIGFVPWMFGLAGPEHAAAWRQLDDPQGFAADFGPTSVERRSLWFMHEANQGCCRWDGPSWPYATSQTLTALADLLIDYPPQPHVDAADYIRLLRTYARTQHRDGQPYVAEAHDPDAPVWIYDARAHSEDYNHSTFADLVLSGLLGLRPQSDDTLVLHPLAPPEWDHFAVENVPYHGHNVTVLWDRGGSRYGQGAGLSVFINGSLEHRQETLAPVTIGMPAARMPELRAKVDLATNLDPAAGFPKATASFSAEGFDPAKAVDGQKHFLDLPSTRWSTLGSPNPEDWLALDFGATRTLDEVRVFFHGNGTTLQPPASWWVERCDSTGQWRRVPDQLIEPAHAVANDLNRATFPAIALRELRLVMCPQPQTNFAIAEVQCWCPSR